MSGHGDWPHEASHLERFELPPPRDDGLIAPEVGEHSKDKHYFLERYIYAFTTLMRKKWRHLHYIDLFAGAGITRLKKSRKLSWGSPLIAAQAQTPFDNLHYCEKSRKKREALRIRVGRLRSGSNDQILDGDANKKINEIVEVIPSTRSLSLAFLDPCGLHLDYETLRTLSFIRCDLIIYFPDRVDFLRNWKLNYFDDPESNPDRVLGPDADWRSVFEHKPKSVWVEALRNLYVAQIKKLGYRFFEYERIFAKRLPIYQLIFCSGHRLGADLWRRVATKKPDDQQTFDFGSDSA